MAATAPSVRMATSDLNEFIKSFPTESLPNPISYHASDSDNESLPSLVEDSFDQSFSAESPSEDSAATPNQYTTPRIVLDDSPTLNTTHKGRKKAKPPPISILPSNNDQTAHLTAVQPLFSPAPVLQPSMVQLSDFNYDRYSVILDSPTRISEYDSDELYSPIEVATPIAFQIPKLRPMVISVRTPVAVRHPRSFFDNVGLPNPHLRPSPPPRSPRRLNSGFLAAEATPFELPPSPNPSVPSLSTTLTAQSIDEPPDMDGPQKSIYRKSSLPLLSTAFKSSNNRVSSLRSLLRSQNNSTDNASIVSESRYSSRTGSKKSSLGDLALTDHERASITSGVVSGATPIESKRTSSIRHSTQSSITALPMPPPSPMFDPSMAIPEDEPVSEKPKSHNMRHSRRKSISQVFKLGKTRKQHSTDLTVENPLPPIDPSIDFVRPATDRSLSSYPTPHSPSVYRTSVMPKFPQASSRLSSNHVGLGIGRNEEIRTLNRTQSGY